MAKHYHTKENIVFDVITYLLVLVVIAICLIPFIYIVSASFSGSKPLINGEVFLWPKEFNLNAYRKIFTYPNFLHAYGIVTFIRKKPLCRLQNRLLCRILFHRYLLYTDR